MKRSLTIMALLFSVLLSGCGSQIAFEPVDYKGHVRIEIDGEGYCFRVPKEWEIRERLEGADVVCLAPLDGGFRDSIVAKSLTADKISDPEKMISEQLTSLGESVEVRKAWTGPDQAVVVVLKNQSYSKAPLGQLLFLHLRPSGDGVLITCTTEESELADKEKFFSDIVAKTKYDIKDCAGPGGMPKVFPTPEVTLSPAP